MTRLLICDDTPEDLNAITAIIESFYGEPPTKLAEPFTLTKFSDPESALSFIKSGNALDIAILDIMMPEMNGMDLAKQLRGAGFEGFLVFLTTFNDFAAQSYGVEAFSYILKPAKKELVFKLLEKIEDKRRANDKLGFLLTRKNGTRFILYSQLLYVEVVKNQLFFRILDDETISVYATLKDYSEILLKQPQMLKPHRSFIVNLDYVRACENSAVIMRDGKRISVPQDFETVKEKWLVRKINDERGGYRLK